MAYLVAAAITSLWVVGSIPLRISFFAELGKVYDTSESAPSAILLMN